MKVFVTVDDLGMAAGINSGVEMLLHSGVIHCLSIMATGPELPGAVELGRSYDVAVSVHLNCVQPPFLVEDGFPGSHFAWFRKGAKYAEKVRNEWRSQIEKVLSTGLTVTRLDSHQHIHNAAGLREVILDLAGEYGIGAVRGAVLPERWHSPSCFILDRLGRRLLKSAVERGISTPDLMLGFSRSGNVCRDYLESIDGSIECDGVAELVMHPATSPVWASTQTDELELMRSEWFAEWLRKHL
ncbi:MAG: ChbG/HpnK family deacetylase [Candidatus Aegiribacteria sp.]|nr:ChbG/HpnK family deacetylase [Candidatus Aegiribacteria sp.]